MQSSQSKGRAIALWVLGLATIAGFAVFAVLDAKMYDAGGPGIIRFELVADRISAARILNAWGSEGRDAAEQSLWFDFAFILIYGAFLLLAVRSCAESLARRGYERLAWVGSWMWMFVVAGMAFDVFEDIALLAILGGNTSRAVPSIATFFVVLKYAVLMNAVLYLIVAVYTILKDRRNQRPVAD